MSAIVLHTERLILATLDELAAPQVLAYLARNQHFWQAWNTPLPLGQLTPEAQQQRLASDREQRQRYAGYRFWLFEADDIQRTTIVGDLGLSNIVWGAFLSCHLGYKIDEAAAKRGYMTEAVRAAVRFAFDTLELHRVEANIMPRNARSCRVVEKLGFAHEGSSPAYLKINGVWEEHMHYVVLNPDV